VVLSHLSFLKDVKNPLQWGAQNVFCEGFIGVSFFFLLSGFVMAYSYEKKLQEKTVTLKQYMGLRLARIFPMHILISLILIGSAYMLGDLAVSVRVISTLFFNLSLLQSWIPKENYYFSLNTVSWSLSAELFFYTAFIGLVNIRTKKLTAMAIGLGVVILILEWVFIGYRVPVSPHWVFYILPITRLLEFLLGILIYRYRYVFRFPTFHEICSVVALGVAMVSLPKIGIPLQFRYQLAYLPFVAYVLSAFVQGEGWISEKLKGKSWILLGEASFMLYLVHKPIIHYIGHAQQRGLIEISALGMAILAILGSVAVAVLSHKIIEKPVYQSLRRKLGVL
jgi:peptidoglycan/LPS O-acetylase OafA/YrhL